PSIVVSSVRFSCARKLLRDNVLIVRSRLWLLRVHDCPTENSFGCTASPQRPVNGLYLDSAVVLCSHRFQSLFQTLPRWRESTSLRALVSASLRLRLARLPVGVHLISRAVSRLHSLTTNTNSNERHDPFWYFHSACDRIRTRVLFHQAATVCRDHRRPRGRH